MKLLVMSDLHFEFMNDLGYEFLNIEWPEHDVCIIAGDLVTHKYLEVVMRACCATFKEVIYVAGNHEYWRSTISAVKHQLQSLKIPNLHYLDNSSCVVGGQRFIGGTMWFRPEADTSLRGETGDFKLIGEIGSIFYENEEFIAMLNQVKRDDVVITHYLPSYKSIPKKFKDEVSNCYFVCDVEKEIFEYQPKLWIHGHTHSSADYQLGATRVYANPLGIRGENLEFDSRVVLDL